jgi:hypothetical protein
VQGGVDPSAESTELDTVFPSLQIARPAGPLYSILTAVNIQPTASRIKYFHRQFLSAVPRKDAEKV